MYEKIIETDRVADLMHLTITIILTLTCLLSCKSSDFSIDVIHNTDMEPFRIFIY